MMDSPLPGIWGTLFPGRFLAARLPQVVETPGRDVRLRRRQAHLLSWWTAVAASCGPATGPRAIFDVVAMPLFGVLGFRAHDAEFDRSGTRVRLETPRRASVGLVVLPWAARPSTAWRQAVTTARLTGAEWCFVLAPPFLSLVSARGSSLRRSAEFALPDALADRSIVPFLALTSADAFDRPRDWGFAPIDGLVASADSFADGVRRDLQAGVAQALAALTSMPPRQGTPAERFGEALTLVYRILFLLFAESRDLVPCRHPVYRGAYAVGTLCREARNPNPPAGLWDGLAAITRLSRAGCHTDDLIVRPFNGRLFARRAAPSLERAGSAARPTPAALTRDAAMRTTLLALATRLGPAGREDIAYADLGVEQLGAVYERVLDLDPSAPTRQGPANRHSRHRKRTGTFYTPQRLAEFVVRRTLAPLVLGRSADEILALRVVDPAMGSGAFLVAACRYLAGAYERALIDEGRCSQADMDDETRGDVRRLIAERCLAGVDANPVAVQLGALVPVARDALQGQAARIPGPPAACGRQSRRRRARRPAPRRDSAERAFRAPAPVSRSRTGTFAVPGRAPTGGPGGSAG